MIFVEISFLIGYNINVFPIALPQIMSNNKHRYNLIYIYTPHEEERSYERSSSKSSFLL